MNGGLLTVIGAVQVRSACNGLAFTWVGGLAIDADGCPTAYCPRTSGLLGRDVLANALVDPHGDWENVKAGGKPLHGWAGLVVDADGNPVVQGKTDPAPGYYVSTTALIDRTRQANDPWRYVDSWQVAYLAVPPEMRTMGVHLGDVARVEYCDQYCGAIVADIGPRGRLGEGSMALARQLGINASPVHGGVGGGVTVTVWPASGTVPPWPRSRTSIEAQVEELWAKQT